MAPRPKKLTLEGKASRRAFWISDARWAKLQKRADSLGKTVSDLLRDLIRAEISKKPGDMT